MGAPKISHDDAAAVMLATGRQPLEAYPGSHEPWRCRCITCGQESTPTYMNVRKGRSARCKYCAGNGPIAP